MKIEFKKIKINTTLLIRYIYPITIVVVIIVLGCFSTFLYRNVYQTIAQAKSLTELKKEVPEEGLAKQKFQEIIKKIDQKKQPTDIDFNTLKNPFPLPSVEKK